MGIEIDRETGVEGLSFSKEEMWTWLNGHMHVLHEGKDYPRYTAFEDIRKRIRQGAWRRGVTVKVINMGGTRVMVQSNEDANQYRDMVSTSTRHPREPTPEEIEKLALMHRIGDLELEVEDLRRQLMKAHREHSAYRLAHPIR